MSDSLPISVTQDPENLRREFLNSIYFILAGLSIHDLKNAALTKPLKSFETSYHAMLALYHGRKIELKVQEGVIFICGDRLNAHFSIVEGTKLVVEAFESITLESLIFEPEVTVEQVGQLFSKWAVQKSVGGKPRQLAGSFENIELKYIDPAKLQLKVKNKQLLMSSTYCLQRYFMLKRSLEEFFKGMTSQELKSQKGLKRDILELVEVARAAPYNLVALSLIRPDAEGGIMPAAVGQALSTSMLSIVMAQELEFSFKDEVNLGLVGLLYNVGLIGEDPSLLQKNEKLTPVEYKRILDAQASGVYKLIRVQGSSRPVLERLLSIFEHSKGPQVQSMSLTLESRLLRMLSQYVALTSDRPFRDAYTPAEAIRLLGSKATSAGGAALDPILYYLFVRFIGVYPVGSLVLLSNNEKAIVYRPHGEKQGHAMVKLCVKDSEATSPLIDLGLETGLEIVKALDPKREGIRVEGYFFE